MDSVTASQICNRHPSLELARWQVAITSERKLGQLPPDSSSYEYIARKLLLTP
jgi:hypothetical protein